MDPELEQYNGRGVCDSTIDILTKNGFTTWSLLQAMETGDPQAMDIDTLAQRRILLKIASEGPLPTPPPASTTLATHAKVQGRAAQDQGTIPGHGTASLETQSRAHAAAPSGQAGTQHGAHHHTISSPGGCPGNHSLDPLAALGDQLAGLFTNIATPTLQLPQTQLPPGSLSGGMVDLNPLHYLLPNQRAKFKDMCDYVQEGIDQQEEVVGRGDGTEFVVRTSIRKVKLEQVSPMQWSAANIRIPMDLLREGELQPRGILDYLAYRVKVSRLATPCVSALQWDRVYQRLQQQMGFRWGSDSPHLSSLYLLLRSLCLPRTPGHSLRGPLLPKVMLSQSVTSTTRVNVNIRRSATLGMSACSQAVSNLIRQHSTYPQKMPMGGDRTSHCWDHPHALLPHTQPHCLAAWSNQQPWLLLYFWRHQSRL